jgi:3-deoxy-D-manno-octulosonic-acid transferase
MRAFIVAALLCSAPAWAQSPNCAPREAIAQDLNESHGERFAFVATAPNGSKVEFWINAASGSWSMLIDHPQFPGISCLVANGQDFRQVPLNSSEPPKKSGKGA